MMSETELLMEQAYTEKVQQLLLTAIANSSDNSRDHIASIKQLMADAWDELRLKPTALSEQDMQQLAGEVDRYLARKALNDNLIKRYEQMLKNPFFARVDFCEEGRDETEKIVIGLYSLKGPGDELLVHDWRAPVCSLYYDEMPGPVRYESPSGQIRGVMSLKRQYKMEDGRLKYYVNTDVSIEDEVLLDILSGATRRKIRQIVSTIQTEQNRAIRFKNEKLLSVVGSAGSGKTSVAMHRIAYLMYRYRDKLEAARMLIISPSNSFSEYISNVLPELGEENVTAVTLSKLMDDILPGKLEKPLNQNEVLLRPESQLRRLSVRLKSGLEFMQQVESFCEEYARTGPVFRDVLLDDRLLASAEELERMYRKDFSGLKCAERIERIHTVLDSRLSRWEISLFKQYREQLMPRYRGKDLEVASRFAVSHRLSPLRKQIREMLNISAAELYVNCLKGMPGELVECARENAKAGIVWWEDAGGMALMMLLMGFANPDKAIRHLVMDEAQDHSACTLRMLKAYYPYSNVTLLGDPKQRTTPGMPMLDVGMWNKCFDRPAAPCLTLSRCYRSTLGITRLCNAILPDQEQVVPFGREGALPEMKELSDEAILDAVSTLVKEGFGSIAVITRTLEQADRVSRFVPRAHLLDGSDEDILSDPGDISVGGYQLMKGLEFDAVVVAWPYAKLTDGERRRLYTACSRALHRLYVLADGKLLSELGIIL